MLALIDGDVLVYRVGYTTNDDEEWIARARLREMIGGILKAVNTMDYKIFLSDSKNNWRLDIFPNYKANRVQPKPKHLPYLQNLIVDEWGAEVAWGQEADDALGITQTEKSYTVEYDGHDGSVVKSLRSNTIICSIDKDLLQIPGQHYNFVKEEMKFVTPEEGLFRFYEQTLIGDSGDNITVAEGLSCKGIGPKKAYKLLEGCETDLDYFLAVQDAYTKGWSKDGLTDEEIVNRLLTTGQLVKIRTKEGEIWQFPVNSQVDQTQ
jgi:5'-3' exonuclease